MTTPGQAKPTSTTHEASSSPGSGQQRQLRPIPPEAARKFTKDLLIAHGTSTATAEIVADALVLADLRGIDTHGINRLLPYIRQIRNGALHPASEPTFHSVTPVVGQVDGRNGFGFAAAALGMEEACKMAAVYGIGMVSVKHSNHFGMSAWIVQQALDYRAPGKEAGMMSLVFTNSSPAMPAWGGREKILGVSPLACGAPGPRDGRPFILDMAPSVAARGKVHKALRRGEQIPEGWAIDADGKPTIDPAQALKGVMLPMGGPKGSALAIMMDIFSGVLSGSGFAGNIAGPYDDASRPADVGHFLVAIQPGLFLSEDDFRERMSVLYQKVLQSERMIGVEQIYLPGETEQITCEERQRSGIPFTEEEIEALNGEASQVGIAPIGHLA